MTLQAISLFDLLICFLPVAMVIGLMWRWQLAAGKAVYAMARMLAQLLLIGYVLVYIFASESSWLVLTVLLLMIIAASGIALNTSNDKQPELYLFAFVSVLFGGGSILALMVFAILSLDPWFKPNYVIPLAGMVFANAMTSISLATERLDAELTNGVDYERARLVAFQTAMIPIINALFAIGLVSLPGMMTGQILSGVSPFIAARYQIMVMCMLFSSAGLATACFLYLCSKRRSSIEQQ